MAKALIYDSERKRWIQFDEDTEVLLRFADKAKVGEIMKKAAKRAKLSGGDVDAIANQMVGEYIVLGWRHIDQEKHPDHPGFTDMAGNPLPFTAETRDRFMKKWREFSNFVNENGIDSAAFADDAEDAEVREAVKND
jgi:hypothetical protein